jgi:hypothetical protein
MTDRAATRYRGAMAWLVRIALLRFLGRRVLWFLMVYDVFKLVLAARRALLRPGPRDQR